MFHNSFSFLSLIFNRTSALGGGWGGACVCASRENYHSRCKLRRERKTFRRVLVVLWFTPATNTRLEEVTTATRNVEKNILCKLSTVFLSFFFSMANFRVRRWLSQLNHRPHSRSSSYHCYRKLFGAIYSLTFIEMGSLEITSQKAAKLSLCYAVFRNRWTFTTTKSSSRCSIFPDLKLHNFVAKNWSLFFINSAFDGHL